MYLFDFFIVVSTLLHLNKARLAEYNPSSDDNQPTCLSCQLLNHSQLARVTMAQVVLFSLPAQVGLTLHWKVGLTLEDRVNTDRRSPGWLLHSGSFAEGKEINMRGMSASRAWAVA